MHYITYGKRYIPECIFKWLRVYMLVCGPVFPKTWKMIKDQNLGVGNQLTEMVGTFASIKRDVILNSVLWVLRGLMEGGGWGCELTAVGGWQWVRLEDNSHHDERTAHHLGRYCTEDSLNLPLVWKKQQLHLKNSSHIHTWELSAAAVTSSESESNNLEWGN